jgi:hypothetical protein
MFDQLRNRDRLGWQWIFGEQRLDPRVEVQLAAIDEREQEEIGQRLADRPDLEEVVGSHRNAPVPIREADAEAVRISVRTDQGDQHPGEALCRQILGGEGPDPFHGLLICGAWSGSCGSGEHRLREQGCSGCGCKP